MKLFAIICALFLCVVDTNQDSAAIENLYEHSVINLKEIGDVLSSVVMKSYDEIGNLLKRLQNDMKSALHDISDDAIKLLKQAKEFIKSELIKMKTKYSSLATLAEDQYDMVMTHINDTLIEKTGNMDLWSNKIKLKMAAFNDSTIYKNKCELIDNFIQSSVNELHNCCSIAINPVNSMCRLVQETITETIDVVVKIIEKVENCILEQESYLNYMIPCLNDAYDSFGYLLTKADSIHNDLMDILPVKIIFSDYCIAFVTVSVENRIIYIENDIENELKQQRQFQGRNFASTNYAKY